MTVNQATMAFAGVMVIVSVLLTWYVSHYFLWFTVFIGANMLQSAFTKTCPAIWAFRKMGLQDA